MNDFLLAGYETPEIPSQYMEFEEGVNSFRILSNAIVGFEWWVANGKEGRKPVRVRTAEEVPDEVRSTLDDRRRARHFWAFTVYNYTAKAVQMLVLKQQTIMRAIEVFGKSPKWGDPRGMTSSLKKPEPEARRGMWNIMLFQNRQQGWILVLPNLQKMSRWI
jgi:hypothetical protein